MPLRFYSSIFLFILRARNLADFFVEDPTEYLVPNETMFAKVVEKKPDDQKVAMSSKLKDVATGNSDHAVLLMETLLQDLDRISKTSPIVAMKVGSVVSARVNEVSDFGIDATTSRYGHQLNFSMSTMSSDLERYLS